MRKKEKKNYSDFPNVDNQRNELIPEEFPEGAFGSAINKEEIVTGKSSPWGEGQYRGSAFVYPDKSRHDDLPRQTPGAHPIHDGSDETEEKEQ